MIRRVERLSEVDLRGCRLLILDFDGVVTRLDLDWRALKRELSALCLREHGLEVAFSPLASGRARLLRERGPDALRDLDLRIAERETAAVERASLSPELPRLLEASDDADLAVFSSSSRRAVLRGLQRFGLADRVGQVVAREDVRSAKPAPEGLERLLQRTGHAAGDAVFVGDREIDGEAGAAAGIRTFLVPPGEEDRLESIARGHDYEEGFNGRLARYRARAVREVVPRGGSLLEVGCAGGALAELLADHVDTLTLVDASETYLARARRRLGARARYHHCLLEEFDAPERYDCVLASGVLEHVADPVAVARRLSGWLKSDGCAVFLVPNALSLHRRIGRAMGVIEDVHELQAHDHEVGHRRYYDARLLRRHLEEAGLDVRHLGGVFLKPVANWQMEDWSPALCDAFDEVGRQLPDYCAEILALCRLRRGSGSMR